MTPAEEYIRGVVWRAYWTDRPVYYQWRVIARYWIPIWDKNNPYL